MKRMFILFFFFFLFSTLGSKSVSFAPEQSVEGVRMREEQIILFIDFDSEITISKFSSISPYILLFMLSEQKEEEQNYEKEEGIVGIKNSIFLLFESDKRILYKYSFHEHDGMYLENAMIPINDNVVVIDGKLIQLPLDIDNDFL